MSSSFTEPSKPTLRAIVSERVVQQGQDASAVRTFIQRHFGWLTFVALPTVVVAFYAFVLAWDRYESEVKFVVRNPSGGISSQISSVLKSAGASGSSDDAYLVNSYMASRAAIRALGRNLDLLAIVGRPRSDLIWRYPGPFQVHYEERLYRHLQHLISIGFDSQTGISTLRVQAFTPEDARTIASTLLHDAEALVNRLSERGQQDAINSAIEEVDSASTAASRSLEELTKFRNTHLTIDPTSASKAEQEILQKLALQAALAQAQLTQLERSSPQSPQVAVLRTRVEAFEGQMKQQRERMAGMGGAVPQMIADFERLSMQRDFSERSFSSALASLELARHEARRQKLFLEVIGEPLAPDYPAYPSRFFMVLVAFATFLALYRLGRRLIAEVRFHSGI